MASRALGIEHEKIHIAETSTDKVSNKYISANTVDFYQPKSYASIPFTILQVPNTSPTAASSGSDINGAAVLDACNKINKRIQPYKDKAPDAG